jgi:hypothetical protein
MLFARTITDATGMCPQKRRYCDMPVGYSGQVALRMEQCDIMEQFNRRSHSLINMQAVARQWLTHTSCNNIGAVGGSVSFVA